MDTYLRCKIPTLSFHTAAPFAGKSSLKLCIANTDEMKKLQFKVQQQKDLLISIYYEKQNMTNNTWEQKWFTIHIDEHGNQTKTLDVPKETSHWKCPKGKSIGNTQNSHFVYRGKCYRFYLQFIHTHTHM